MANIKSSKKRILLSEKARKTNSHFKSRMKTLLKKAFVAIEEKASDVEQIVRDVLQTIDKTAAKGIIHKNAAARHKSRLAVAFNTGVIPASAKEKIAQGNNKKSTTKSRSNATAKETASKNKRSAEAAEGAEKQSKPKSTKTAGEKKPAAPRKKATTKKETEVAETAA